MHEMPPLVLIASRDEWTTRSLESVLAPAGFAIARAYGAAQLVERARTVRPDVILLGTDLAGETGASVCRRLRDRDGVPASTPILLLHPGPVRRSERMDALRAGAWDVLAFPTDPDELRVRLRLYGDAKRDADAARSAADVDVATGIYTPAGLLRRTGELAALARRLEQPIACVVFETRTAADAPQDSGDGELGRVAAVFRDVGRRSDVVGRVDARRLAVLAADTDEEGARGLARRFQAALDPAAAATLRAGCWAVSDAATAPEDPREMILLAGDAATR